MTSEITLRDRVWSRFAELGPDGQRDVMGTIVRFVRLTVLDHERGSCEDIVSSGVDRSGRTAIDLACLLKLAGHDELVPAIEALTGVVFNANDPFLGGANSDADAGKAVSDA